jgi:hypothetical protein
MSKQASHPGPAIAAPPPNIDEHTADMARRYKEDEAARGRLLDCLDPSIAKQYEDRKPIYEWRVKAEIFRKSQGNKQAYMEKFDKQVVAQSEQDAWAIFCDSVGEWPSPRDAKREITKLGKRTLRNSLDDN